MVETTKPPSAAKVAEAYPAVPGVAAVAEKLSQFKVPEGLKPYIDKVQPWVRDANKTFQTIIIPKAVELYQSSAAYYDRSLAQYNLDSLVPALLGLVVCFCGGTFVTLIAAAEAYRLTGWKPTFEALSVLRANAEKAIAATKKDDDAKVAAALSEGDNRKRKVALALAAVDPEHVSDAVRAVTAGFFAVLAVLRVQFAKAITLGAAIGDALLRPAQKYAEPFVGEALPAELKKWSATIVKVFVKVLSITIAWLLARTITAVHSAIRGGLTFSRGILTFLNERKITSINLEESSVDEILGGIVAFAGIYTQLNYGFSLPFPLNVLLFPLSFVESILSWIVGV